MKAYLLYGSSSGCTVTIMSGVAVGPNDFLLWKKRAYDLIPVRFVVGHLTPDCFIPLQRQKQKLIYYKPRGSWIGSDRK